MATDYFTDIEPRKRPLNYEDLYDLVGESPKKLSRTDVEEGEIPEETKEKSEEKPLQEEGELDESDKMSDSSKDDDHEHTSEKSRRSRDHDKKDRERNKDRSRREEHREKERDRERERKDRREREKELERHKSKEREKERERRKEKDRSREREREREKERDREKERERRERQKEKEREKSRGRSPISEKHIQSKAEEKREEETEQEYRERVAAQIQQLHQDDDEERLRKARERREAILRKYREKNKEQIEQSQESKPSEEKEQIASVTQEGKEERIEKISTSSSSSPLDAIPGDSEIPDNVTSLKIPEPSFNMFCESPMADQEMQQAPKLDNIAANLTEVIDDAEGYYCYRMGEILNERYQLMGGFGKGVFSTVVRAKDLQNESKEVAVKVLRNNEAMKRIGLKEIQLLKDLAAADPDNKYNIVRLLDSFEDREHLCLVFEPMNGGNLREVLRKYGTRIGLSIKAVKIYGQKLMLALKLLKKSKILHADIKLDNILVNETKTSVRLGDFGSASSVAENTITPYLVSRYYRAPEIILGLPYSYELDMWSVGCCLYEICTGKILFSGESNNDMLYLQMEVSGPIPKKMIKKGEYAPQHFDEGGNFKRVMKDSITGKRYIKICNFAKPTRDLKAELLNSPYDLSDEEKKMILQLHDLLSQIFVFDPSKRIPVEKALRHEFFTSN